MWKQLNRVAIPIFSGDKKNYAGWRAAFDTCVDAAPATAEYKLLQLRNYLRGDALKSIESLGHSSSAYDAAKQRLERKFGGERRQIALRLEELESFRPMKDGNAKEVDKLADVLDLLVINLQEAGQMDEMGSGSLYVKVLKKMTETMVTNYKRWADENAKIESLELLRDWVNREAQYKTIAAETVRGIGGRAQQDKTFHGQQKTLRGGTNRTRESSGIAYNCVVCGIVHPI